MADHDALIAEFKGITQEDDERSRFYLESANWQLNVALSSFFDNANDPEPMDTGATIPPSGSSSSSENDGQFYDSKTDFTEMKTSKTSQSSSNSRLRSLADYGKDEKKGSDSEDEGQEFYAGGSEHSGEVILGPGKKKRGEDIVSNMFKNAKKHGAVPVDEAAGSSTEKKKATKYFTGGGYKLGAEASDHEFIPGAEKQNGGERKKMDIVLKLWKNGFTVGDGPLRDYHDKDTREFLGAIAKGEIPQELIKMAKGGEVSLDMEDHKSEDFVPEKVKMKAFTGEGHTLGGITPAVVTASPAPTKPAETSPVDPDVIIDENSPVTTIRVQLGDGSRVTQKFNHSHLVSDVYSFVRERNRDNDRHFVLMTTFPNKELTEDSTTLIDGKLLNAVIVQRFK